MGRQLKTYFPEIWDREELLKEIQKKRELSAVFHKWELRHQEEFLNFCTGVRGIKLMYDGFFKEIFNPEYVPERLEEVLSLLLKMKVRIYKVLPNDSTRLADESSLLITDIIVELEDGSLVNIEVQKIGYHFPGQRSACYSADMLLRQYKRIRSIKKEKFNYRDIKDVYIIVFFEKSTSEFRQYPEEYLHFFSQQSDTGLEMELLQKFLFIPLDIFHENQQNKIIKNKLDAWLLFLSSDEPEDILRLCDEYPEFRAMYQEAYQICRNLEGVMGFFSEELRILDRNTVQYMMDEMQAEIDEKRKVLETTQGQLETTQGQLETTQGQLETTQGQLETTQEQLALTQEELQETKKQLVNKEMQIQKLESRMEELEKKISTLM